MAPALCMGARKVKRDCTMKLATADITQTSPHHPETDDAGEFGTVRLQRHRPSCRLWP